MAQEKADLEADNKVLRQQLSTGVRDVTLVKNHDETDSTPGIETATDENKRDERPKEKDPNRPRFTLKELQKVLKERNELKEKVIALKEDLAYYKQSRYVEHCIMVYF